MVEINNKDKNISIKIKTYGNSVSVLPHNDSSNYYSALSKDWACKENTTVDGVEYSSKHYALISKKAEEKLNNNPHIRIISEDLLGNNNIKLCATNMNDINNATRNAQLAKNQAHIATEQAQIATNKVKEINSITHSKANIDLTNLSSIGQNIANWSSNITNCITEIPQDIKLELKEGAIIVKAGSKLTNLDGTYRKLDRDLIHTILGYGKNLTHILINHPYLTPEYLQTPSTDMCYSGTGYPNIKEQQYMYYLDTNNKHFYFTNNTGSSWEDRGVGSVLGVVTSNTTKYVAINQVFNGFGYIGSTQFSLPGIKCLAPDGKNSDGSLKNYEFTSKEVRLNTYPYTTAPTSQPVCLSSEGLNRHGLFVVSETRPAEAPWVAWFNTKENIIYWAGEDGKYINTARETLVIPNITTGIDTRIISFNPKQPFYALDHNDTRKWDYVVEDIITSNNTRFRKWKSGRCEEQGYLDVTTTPSPIITFYKPFIANPEITVSGVGCFTQISSVSKTNFTTNTGIWLSSGAIGSNSGESRGFWWHVIGEGVI